ncbi:thymidylate kinase [Candidatus Uhrbacteria bacterium]|nr:thymidylate kinase [Candidatus Uhrbacteria bacterium]
MRGTLIAIEGTDGSGKGTQIALLAERLRTEGRTVAVHSFPQYGKKSAGLVEEYLNGAYGHADSVDPHAASLFFALDRFDASRAINDELAEGAIVLLDRYIDSNVGHQGGKIRNEDERARYVAWLYDLEFRILKNPRPDFTLVIHVPPSIGQEMVKKKAQRSYLEGGKTHDMHEGDLQHLQHAEEAFLWLVQTSPNTHELIESYTDRLLTPQEVHEKVWSKVHAISFSTENNAESD